MPAATISFTKMHGLGNDFIAVLDKDLISVPGGSELITNWPRSASSLAKTLCNRHCGVGADGLILVIDLSGGGRRRENRSRVSKRGEEQRIIPPAVLAYPKLDDCELAWIFTNSDGSPANICGNALRCVTLLARENKLFSDTQLSIATAVGPIHAHFHSQNKISIDLGKPLLRSIDIPVDTAFAPRVVKHELEVGGYRFQVTCVNNGNPHCVIFEAAFLEKMKEQIATDKTLIMPELFKTIAQAIQSLPLFPQGANIEFAFAIQPDYVRLFVFERGAGATLACASGAAATIVAGVLEGRLKRQATIELPGGCLDLRYSASDDHVTVSGPARSVFKGTVELVNQSSELALCSAI